MKQTVRLAIEGMHCDACVRRVINALNGVEGVRVNSVEVGSASIAFDPGIVATKEITTAVDGIGYKAQVER